MEFANGERNYAFAGTANKTLRSELNKTTQLFSLSERFAASADFVFFVSFIAKKMRAPLAVGVVFDRTVRLSFSLNAVSLQEKHC